MQIMLEIAAAGHLFDDKTHPALNGAGPLLTAGFQMAAELLCVAAGIQS